MNCEDGVGKETEDDIFCDIFVNGAVIGTPWLPLKNTVGIDHELTHPDAIPDAPSIPHNVEEKNGYNLADEGGIVHVFVLFFGFWGVGEEEGNKSRREISKEGEHKKERKSITNDPKEDLTNVFIRSHRPKDNIQAKSISNAKQPELQSKINRIQEGIRRGGRLPGPHSSHSAN